MTDLEALTLLVATTVVTAGLLTVGLLQAFGRLPRDRRSTRKDARSWRAVARITWPATWGLTLPPAPTTAEAAELVRTRQRVETIPPGKGESS